MKKILIIIALVLILPLKAEAGFFDWIKNLFENKPLTFGAPSLNYQRSILPIDSTENLGTTTSPWDELHVNEICLSADCKTAWPVGGGSGNVATSSAETAGYLPYWTSTNGTPATLGKVATTTVTCSGDASCNPFTVIGSAPVVISAVAGGGVLWSTTSQNYFNSLFRDWSVQGNGYLAPTTTRGIIVNASSTIADLQVINGTTTNATTTNLTVSNSASIPALKNLTSNGFVKTSGGNGTLSIDTNTYLTGNQTITLSGDASGSGSTAITVTVADDSHAHTGSTISGLDISADTNLAVTSPIILTDDTVSIQNAGADGSTKGAASFTAADFDSSSGNISIDYTNGQSASASNKGFLTSADWTLFNNKISSTSLSATSPIEYNSSTGVISCPTCGISTGNWATTSEAYYWSQFRDFTVQGDGYLAPTTTRGLILTASSTIQNLTVVNGTTTNSTTTNSYDSGTTRIQSLTGLLKGTSGVVGTASAGTDYEVPLTFGDGLTRTLNDVDVDTTQNITNLSNLTSNGFVKTSGGNGTLSVDTTTYESGLTAGDGLTRTVNDFDCDTANGSTFGCLSSADWTTFNNKQATISTTFPITLSGATVGFGGLTTSTPAVIGNIPYFSGVNSFANVATTTASCSGDASCTPFTVIGSSPVTISSTGGAGGSWATTSSNYYNSQFRDWSIVNGALSPTTTLGVGVYASSTIGNGVQGLTIAGAGTTTGRAYFANNVGIGTTTPYARLSVQSEENALYPVFEVASSSNATKFFTVTGDGDVIITGNATGTDTVKIGVDTIAGGLNSIAIGTGAEAPGNSTIAFGSYSSAIGTGAHAFGDSSVADGSNAYAVGGYSEATGNATMAIGNTTFSRSNSAVAIGTSASISTNSTEAAAFGYNTDIAADSEGSTAIGSQSYISGATYAVALGWGAGVANSANGSIALGYNAYAPATGQLAIGGSGLGITDVYIGESVTNTTPVGVTIQSTGRSGTNGTGVNTTIAGGKGTGTGAGGSVVFSTSDKVGSGTTLQSLTEKMRILWDGNVGIGTSSPYSKLSVVGTTTMSVLEATSTSATSTIAGGLRVTGGGLRVSTLQSCDTIDTDANGNLICGTDATGGGGSAFGQAWELYGSGTYLAPTTTKGIIVNASSTISALTALTATTTNATSTNSYISNKLVTPWIVGSGGLDINGDSSFNSSISLTDNDVTINALGNVLIYDGVGSTISAYSDGELNFDALNDRYTYSGNGATGILNFSGVNTSNKNFLLPNLSGTFLMATGSQNFILGNGTTTNATTTTFAITSLTSELLKVDGNGVVMEAISGTDYSNFGASVGPTELQNTDFGDFTCNGTTCSLDNDTVAEAELDLTAVTLNDFTNDAGFITGNQTITLSGVIQGSGSTAITTSYSGLDPRAWNIVNSALVPTTTIGILVNNSTSTITNLSVNNGTTTNATSTNLYVSGTTRLGSLNGILKGSTGVVGTAVNGTDYTLITATTCSGSDKVSAISADGTVTCSTDQTGGGGSAFGQAWELFGSGTYLAPTTTKPIIVNSSTSTITNLVTVNSTSTSATTTNLAITSLTSELLKVDGNGRVLEAVAGTDYQVPLTFGDALTLTGTDVDFDGGATPSGDLGGTWASPSVTDDSHAHTGATLSGIDISADTNLTAGTGITLTDDDLSIDTSQNISTLSNLTSNGFVKTSGGTGALSVDTNTYLTGNQTITLSGVIQGSGTTGITTSYTGVDPRAWNVVNGALTPTTTTYGILVNHATSTIRNLDMFNSTSTNATSTNLNLSGTLDIDQMTSALLLTGATGIVAEYTGTSCTNQFVRSLSALGAATCATVANTDLANSTISGISLGSNLADLTATNGTLTFSGTYNGGTARSIGLNLGNANTWTALQTFGGGIIVPNSSQNIGLGTTTPWAYTSIGNHAGGTEPIFVVASSSAAVATTTHFIVDQFGKTGVGTTTPWKKFSVTGEAAFDGGTAATSTVYINSTDLTKGGRIILKDVNGTTCTEITTLSGSINSKAVTCP